MTDDSLSVLEEENVLNMKVFVSLREEHFEKLLTVGDHAVLSRNYPKCINLKPKKELQFSQ